jgi:hypothetical protein
MNTLNKCLMTILVMGSAMSIGCNKVFDDLAINPNQPGITGYFTTPEAVNESVGALYGYISTQRSLGASGSKIQIIRSDEASSNSDYGKPGMYGADLNSSYYTLEQPYALMYSAASQASFIIDATPKVDFKGNEALRNAYLGEAHFWRAFAHYYLMINYRKVSPIRKAPENSSDYVRAPETPAEVWDFIQEDLEKAKVLLPNKSFWGATNAGRVSNGSAAALLGKVYLFRSGIEGFYGDVKQTFYTEAAKEFGDIIDGKYGNYVLTTSYADNFDVAHENNSESLFEIQFKGDVDNANFNPGLPTSGLAFDSRGLMLPGAGVGYEGVAHNWLYNEFVNSIDKDGFTDIRMFSTLMFDDLNPEIKLRTSGGNAVRLSGPGGSTWEQLYPVSGGKSGFATTSNPLASPFKAGIKKGLDYSMPIQKSAGGIPQLSGVGAGVREYVYNQPRANGVNWRYIRYADVLLMYAEAVLNGGVAANLSPLQAINQVRERANLIPLNSVSLNDIKHERVLELALEGHRFYDLLRWGELAERFTVLKQQDPNFKKFISSDDYKGFSVNKNEWLPIPINELNTNPKIKQNEGY